MLELRDLANHLVHLIIYRWGNKTILETSPLIFKPNISSAVLPDCLRDQISHNLLIISLKYSLISLYLAVF